MADHRRPEFGKDTAEEWSRSYQNDGKREYDKESKRRQRLRSRNAPMPMFFDDDPGPGRDRSGLIDGYVPKRKQG